MIHGPGISGTRDRMDIIRCTIPIITVPIIAGCLTAYIIAGRATIMTKATVKILPMGGALSADPTSPPIPRLIPSASGELGITRTALTRPVHPIPAPGQG